MKLNFECTTFCNAKCIFCPRYEMTRPTGEMSDELFHKLIKDGKEMGIYRYSPFMNGEPFIFPRIWEWLDYMEKENVVVSLYTNAEFVDVDRLVRYKNIWYLNCSVNAATKETYDKVMRGPNYEKVVKNVNELFKKAKFPVRASMILVDENKHELEQFKKMYRRHKICGFGNWTGDKKNVLARKGEKEACFVLFHQMYILWDGRAVLCCMDYDGKQIVGDANKQTLKEIWESYEWVREKHRKGEWNDIPVCRYCNYNVVNRI